MNPYRTSALKSILREIVVGMISLAVVAYAVSYVAGQQEESAFAFAVTASTTSAVPAGSIVVYGDVRDKSTGKPIRGATLTFARANGNGSYTQVGSAQSASDGTFRIEVAGAPAGEYRLVAEAIVGASTTRSAFHLGAEPGSAYGVRVELINKEYFVLLPLPGY